ncbi:MAG: hypothetical protein JXA25_11910 [Anaerolineales bacterium]|nr:hypothetical protein [Anaerolineales bacterium]
MEAIESGFTTAVIAFTLQSKISRLKHRSGRRLFEVYDFVIGKEYQLNDNELEIVVLMDSLSIIDNVYRMWSQTTR